MNKKVLILMSTYNGQNYIREQLDSILAQTYKDINLLIRDDGSTDLTVSILEEYENKYDKIKVVCGENLGVKNSFRWLIFNADTADYYAFADQDDYWHADKIEVAIKSITNKEIKDVPILYFCNQSCVDADGNFIYVRFPEKNIQPTFVHTLLKNEYSGCTMVMNHSLKKNVIEAYKHAGEDYEALHDVWILLIAHLTGMMIYDAVPHMDFRRHVSNVTEAKRYSMMNLYEKLQKFMKNYNTLKSFLKGNYKNRGNVSKRCQIFLECFEDKISEHDKIMLNYFANYKINFRHWIGFLLLNRYRECFPRPKINVYIMILLKIY